jgi:hypothetical protein
MGSRKSVARSASGTPTQPGATAGKKEPSLGRDVQSKIGQQLRAMYDNVVSQGIPDRFVELLNRLDNGGDGER